MHIRNICKRITVFILVALLVLSAPFASPVLQVHASGAASAGVLLGTGASDEINIVKILDMALNKAGISMSPGKIRDFLQYWWSSVSADMQTLVNDVDTTITTVSDFVDYVASVASDPTKADGLEMVQLTLKFARFCAVQDIKTLADYKNLITQESIFREFLLSYVTDQDGNMIDSVDNNKLAKYQLKSGFISMVRQAADVYIEEHEGYWLMPTLTYKDILVSSYANKEIYDAVVASVRTIPEDGIFAYSAGPQFQKNYFWDLSDLNFVGRIADDKSFFVQVCSYMDNWTEKQPFIVNLPSEGGSVDLSKFSSNSVSGIINYIYLDFIFKSNTSSVSNKVVFTTDGRAIKIWKSLDAFKASSVGQSDIYYSSNYGTFEDSKDTGLTFTGSYYNGSYSHDTIQNTIDNSQTTVDNSVVNNIVNNYITNNYGDGSGSGGAASGDGSGGSGSSGGWWDIGSGISAFIEGIASLLDFLLKLLGDMVGLLSSFLTSVLDVLSGLTALGQGFGDFLGAAFTFLPKECISLIVSSIGAMCVVGVVKAFIK